MLYEAWLKEKESVELCKLSKDFYVKLVQYVKQIRQEGRMLDQKSVKSQLVSQELLNVKRLTRELVKLRFEKIVSHAGSSKLSKEDGVTLEEERMLLALKSGFEILESFLKAALRGDASKAVGKPKTQERIVLRFVREVPAIAGADLRVHGPFSVEDVASVPMENAKVFVKHGVAAEIEVN